MNNAAAAVPFHAGPELERAINKTDFFRLLKAATQHYQFDHFALIRVSDATPLNEKDMVITDVSEKRTAIFLQTLRQLIALTKAKSAHLLTTPLSVKNPGVEDYAAGLMFNEFNNDSFLLIPLFTSEGKKFCLIFSGRQEVLQQSEIADIMLDAVKIFGKLYEGILVAESSGRLTQREVEVVKWTSEGKTSSEIAIILGLSEHTVNSHITAAARKLDAVNRVHMVAIALRSGYVS